MSLETYQQALRAGQKEYRARVARGASPYLAVLDDILINTVIVRQEPLGLVDIPLDSIAGTKTRGRHTAFAPNYMPLLSPETEFAEKWSTLSDAHLQEGIQVPIKAYEFMNRFYVEEGNKRVSVLKFYGAASIPGTVTRLVPRRTDSTENRIYYEFLDFYRLSGINYIWFTREGSFAKLQNAVCKASGESWTKDDRRNFFSFFHAFRQQFEALGGSRLGLTAGDAVLVYLSFYRYSDSMDDTGAVLRRNLEKIWDEVTVLTQADAVELSLKPQVQPEQTPLLQKLMPSLAARPEPLKIVFLHENNAQTSAWTRAHGEGRMAMKNTFGARVDVSHQNDIRPGVDDITHLEAVLRNGAQVVFVTSSQMMPACLKAAAHYPDAKILNCSLNMPHPSVRTYAPRMYEAKYLLGMLAGIVSQQDTVGYVANYPIYGIPASINAFALGLRAVRPQGKVCLRWLCVDGPDGQVDFADRPDITLVSGRDQSILTGPGKDPGLVRRAADGTAETLALPIWRWDVIYQEIVRSILDGTWKKEEAGTGRAINYWWGMSSRAVTVKYAPSVPAGTLQLLKLAQQQIAAGQLDPFTGQLHTQDGSVRKPEDQRFSARELIQMNWLVDNVEGRLPSIDEITTPAVRHLMELQGVAPQSAPGKSANQQISSPSNP